MNQDSVKISLPPLVNSQITVAIAFSEKIGSHVLAFVETKEPSFHHAALGSDEPRKGQEDELSALANPNSPYELLRSAEYFGNLFRSDEYSTSLYQDAVHGTDEENMGSYIDTISELLSPKPSELASEFYGSTALTPAQVREVEKTVDSFSLARIEKSLCENNSQAFVCLERLSDWMGFCQLLSQCMRSEAFQLGRASEAELSKPVDPNGLTGLCMKTHLPAPSHYGKMLERLSLQDRGTDSYHAGLVEVGRDGYTVCAWQMPYQDTSSRGGSNALISLHLSACKLVAQDGKMALECRSKAALIYAFAMQYVRDEHVAVCDREDCRRVFFSRSKAALQCSRSCSTLKSRKKTCKDGIADCNRHPNNQSASMDALE